MIPTPDEALALLKEYNQGEFHLNHGQIVGDCMRWFAADQGFAGEADFWQAVGILHDLDFELYPEEHCIKSQEIMREKGLKNPVLVTSAFHMKRAMLNFEKQGYAPVPFPSDYRTGKKHVFHYVKMRPSVDAMYDNAVVLQETLRTLVTRYFE